MKKWEKRYVGNALRWGLFALIGAMLGATALICVLVPYDEILKYKDGKFLYYYPRAEYETISNIICIAGVLVCLFSGIWELFSKQGILEKLLRIALTAFLAFIFYISTGINEVMTYGFFSGWNLPYGAQEYNIDGHFLILCNSPIGMHHSQPVLCEVEDDNVKYIGSGEMYQGSADNFKITPTSGGYTVTYTETIEGAKVQKSFTAKRKENEQ